VAADSNIQSAKEACEAARALLDAGRAAEATVPAQHAIGLDPGSMVARAILLEAVALLEKADPALVALELAAVGEPGSASAQLALGHAYADLDRPADAERQFKRVLALEERSAAALTGLAQVYLSVSRFDAAEHYARRALERDPAEALASQALAAALEARGEAAEAAAVRAEAYRRQSLFIQPAPASRATVLVLVTSAGGNIPYRHLMPADRYTRLVWYVEFATEDQFAQIAAHDVVFNAIGDVDFSGPTEAPVARFLSANRRPLLNDPAKVALTGRHQAGELFADIPDLVVPKAARLEGGRLADAGFSGPVLVRPTGSHGGQGLTLVERAQDAAPLDAQAYATGFHDFRSADGAYRKYRMIFVEREPYSYHLAIADHWLVHYESAGMENHAARRAEEAAFLADPEAAIGQRAMAAIVAIGRRLDLDYAGVDFSILPDGRVLLFEANATMFVHPEPEGLLAYKNPSVARIADAFQAMLERAAAT
jgi:tetratricopeptide (TPR) repeat protein